MQSDLSQKCCRLPELIGPMSVETMIKINETNAPFPFRTPLTSFKKLVLSGMAVVLFTSSGCVSILSPISGMPAHKVPLAFLARPRADDQPISLARLRQDPPAVYQLDSGDILGVYVADVLGEAEEAPPVQIPEEDSQLPPALGYPIPIRSDGTISLPLLSPLKVQGLTVEQAEVAIRRAYTEGEHPILKESNARIIVTLLRERRYHVIVVRQDVQSETVRGSLGGSAEVGKGQIVELKAYQNDVMHALAETGGLPGLNAKNEVKILRGRLADAERRDAFVSEFYKTYQDPCMCPPPLPEDPSIVTIPLRLPPGEVPTFRPEDIMLEEGDIVYIESRETEFFYTGGLLRGGQFPLPRDYDLDVLGAIAIAGAGVGGGMHGSGIGGAGNIFSAIGGAAPTQLYILRQTKCHGQLVISVDMHRAIEDPNERILVQAGDTLILRYKCKEELANFGLVTFFTFGLAELIRSR